MDPNELVMSELLGFHRNDGFPFINAMRLHSIVDLLPNFGASRAPALVWFGLEGSPWGQFDLPCSILKAYWAALKDTSAALWTRVNNPWAQTFAVATIWRVVSREFLLAWPLCNDSLRVGALMS